MKRPSPKTVSLILLTLGASCLVAGAFIILGGGAALITLGALLIAADLLVGK